MECPKRLLLFVIFGVVIFVIFVICELVASQCISRPGCCTTNLNMRSRPMLQVCQKVDVNESEEASILADRY